MLFFVAIFLGFESIRQTAHALAGHAEDPRSAVALQEVDLVSLEIRFLQISLFGILVMGLGIANFAYRLGQEGGRAARDATSAGG
ncbi:MAG: hypothetical protein WDO13_05755 [Verrucomicrobiota bacterium]